MWGIDVREGRTMWHVTGTEGVCGELGERKGYIGESLGEWERICRESVGVCGVLLRELGLGGSVGSRKETEG